MRSIHMNSDWLTSALQKTPTIYQVGDVVQFYPQIQIDYYASSHREEPYLEHVIYDIYKFRFRPIAKYFNTMHKNCYHYIIQIFPDFKLFRFNWTKPYKSYLKIGKWYEGHGQLRNCGNVSEYNDNIPPSAMDGIRKTGKLTRIYENLLLPYYGNDMVPRVNHLRRSKKNYQYKDVLYWFGYGKNLDNFIKNTYEFKTIDSDCNSTEYRTVAPFIFCVDILN